MLLVLAVLAAIFWLPAPWGIVAVVAATVVEVLEVAFWFWLSRRRRAVTGAEALPGSRGVVVRDGQVRVDGELWAARGAEELEPGDEVEVVSLEPGLVLVVRSPAPPRN